jgi:transcriptional regulator with XRE-family HTH domain
VIRIPRVLINADTFARLRAREGLSRKGLAQAAGISETVITGIERGDNHRNITLGIMAALADALGTTTSELTRPSGLALPCESDDSALEAALAGLNRPARSEEIARALGWPLARTRAAADQLSERLHGTGQSLIRTEWDQLRLAPADALTDDQRLRLAQSSPRSRGLTPRTARILAAFLAGEINAPWLQRASYNERMALSALLNMRILEIVHKPHTHVILGRDFEYLVQR